MSEQAECSLEKALRESDKLVADWLHSTATQEKVILHHEQVNRPMHYRGKNLEAIDVIQDYNLNFLRGSAIKYVLRADKKGQEILDLEKAICCLQKERDYLIEKMTNHKK